MAQRYKDKNYRTTRICGFFYFGCDKLHFVLIFKHEGTKAQRHEVCLYSLRPLRKIFASLRFFLPQRRKG